MFIGRELFLNEKNISIKDIVKAEKNDLNKVHSH